MTYFALFYFGQGYRTKRMPYRSEHLQLASQAAQSGLLVLGGAFAETDDEAMLIFQASDRQAVLDFVAADPYVRHGVVERWELRPWEVAAGAAKA